jgi:hypothetical protein
MSILSISNDGPRVVATNYFGTAAAVRLSALYVSVNAGAFRLLVPDPRMIDATGATHVVVTRGKSPVDDWRDMLELLFEDGGDRPFVAQFGAESVDRMPAAADDGRTDLRCLGYGPDLSVLFDLPARYRVRPRVPYLKPWGK